MTEDYSTSNAASSLEGEEDGLRPRPPPPHLQTYTAGEDGSRLADMAKEFGLQNQRRPRKQVRAPPPPTTSRRMQLLQKIIFDATTEDARMKAVWTNIRRRRVEGTRHDQQQQNQGNLSWHEGDEVGHGFGDDDGLFDFLRQNDDGPESSGQDSHADGLGGDLSAAVLGIVKGMVGPCILYLPHGFACAGYVVALPIMVVSTIMYIYSAQCLLDAWRIESRKQTTIGEQTALLGALRRQPRILLSYPELAYRAIGPLGEQMVKLGIALMQSGVCLTYLIFVPHNLYTSVLHLFGLSVSTNYWLIVMIVLQMPLSWIRDIRKLTPTNFLANALILYGLLTCLAFAFHQAAGINPGVGPFESMELQLLHLSPFRSQWYLFIGFSVLMFEGSITLLVPLQEAVHSEEDRKEFPRVYPRVITCVILFYAVFAVTNWMAFGNSVNTVLTTSLPPSHLATSVQLAYSVAIIFTFPLQNFPSLEIACKTLTTQLTDRKWLVTNKENYVFQRNVIASLSILLLAVIAFSTMNALAKVVSLMGSLLGCPIAYVFPPIIHTQLAKDISPLRRACNHVVAGLGIIAMIFASIITIVTWNSTKGGA